MNANVYRLESLCGIGEGVRRNIKVAIEYEGECSFTWGDRRW